MIRIIGYEGFADEALITYGAAAIEVSDGRLIHSFTRFQQPGENLDESEALTRFQRPWELDDDSLQEEPLVVVAIKRDGAPPYVEDLYPDTGRIGGYIRTKREKPFVYFLLRDRDAFRLYAEEMAAECATAVMREDWVGADALGLIRCALTLTPRDPVLLALRVHLASDKPAARRTADRLLEATTDDVRAQFEQILRACEKSSTETTLYLVKYEDGDQRIGGMDLDAAVAQLAAFDGIHARMESSLRRQVPFLEEDESLPKPRLQLLRAGSAELGFGVLGKNLRERVIRFLELELMARLFRGDIPSELSTDQLFVNELRQILNPPGGATLKHQPIDAENLEPVVVEIPEEDARPVAEHTFRVLGFVQGFYRDIKRAEIRISTTHMESVIISDDGSGLTPLGAEILRSGQGVFRPGIFSLLRRRLASGRVHWHLQKMTLLQPGSNEYIDTLPSWIVPKALFSSGDTLNVSFDGSSMQVGRFHVRTHAANIDAARSWLRSWHIDALELELVAAVSAASEWYPSPAFEHGALTSLMRILLVLGQLEVATIPIDQLVQTIDTRFAVRVRRNNTWRTIRERDDLFEIQEDLVGLSSSGRQWATVLRRFELAPFR